MEKQNTEWEEIQAGVWTPEKDGDSIEGIYITSRKDVGMHNSKAYYLEKDGEQTMLWGSTVLDDKMQLAKYGEEIRITYKGLQKSKLGQDVKMYSVSRRKQPSLEEVKT